MTKPKVEVSKKNAIPARRRGDGSIYWDKSRSKYRGSPVISRPGAKIQRKSFSGDTPREVEEKITRFMSDLVKGRRETKDVTLTRWMTEWLDTASHKPSTRQTHRSQITQYVTPSIGGKRLTELHADDVLELHRFMAAKGLSTSTISHTHNACSRAMNIATRQRRVPYNVFLTVDPPARAPSQRGSMSKPEKAAFHKIIKGRQDQSRWLAAIMLGIRQGEALGLRWKDVHLEAPSPYIVIEWQMTRPPYVCRCAPTCPKPWGKKCLSKTLDLTAGSSYVIVQDSFVLTPPKTERGRRIIPLPDEMLSPMRREHQAYLAARPGSNFRDHEFVWARPNGHPMPHQTDNALWHTLLSNANLSQRTLHEARNTAASDYLASGMDPALQQAILGHSKYSMTMKYQSVNIEMLATAMNKTFGTADKT